MNKFKVFISKIAHAIAHGFEAVFGTQASQDFAKAAEQLLATAFGQVVTAIISKHSTLASTDPAAAKSAAASDIVTAAKDAGISLKDSLVNLLVELGVAKLKGALAEIQAVTTPAPQVPDPPVTS